MLSYKEYLDERRSNHENNPKVSAYTQLRPYRNDPDIYISFTDVDKLGINPKSRYNTPLGIYFFPLKEVWSLIEHKESTRGLPFAGDRPYIWIVKGKNKNFINDMYKDYGSDNFDKDVKTLKKIWEDNLENVPTEFDRLISSLKEDVEDYTERYDRVVTLTDEEIKERYDMSREELLIKRKEKLDKFGRELVLYETNKRDFLLGLWDETYEKALASARGKNPISSFWNLSRLISEEMTPYEAPIKRATKWNWLLRQCGYSGFADKSGKGYIHPSEPTQAVFLTRDAFTVIDKILNKDYGEGIKSLLSEVHKWEELYDMMYRENRIQMVKYKDISNYKELIDDIVDVLDMEKHFPNTLKKIKSGYFKRK